jgi:S-adenosyl methyltransferase
MLALTARISTVTVKRQTGDILTRQACRAGYDYWVGGDHNFQADRDLARTIIALDPNIRATMRANRAFLGRAVRFLAGQAGIRQFLDIGSGIPTENNVHQVAQDTAPGSRAVYVDNDDVAFLVAVLHFIPDGGQAADIVATLRDALAPGSHLVICHACRDEQPSLATSFETVYNSRATAQLVMRSRDEITRLCDGFTLLEPALVWIPQWRPDSPDDVPEDPSKYWALVGVGRYDGPPSPLVAPA